MEKKQLFNLINLYLKDEIEPHEQSELMAYIGNIQDRTILEEFMDESWLMNGEVVALEEDKAKAIFDAIIKKDENRKLLHRKVSMNWIWKMSAAAILIFVSFSVLFFLDKNKSITQKQEYVKILPGKNSAYLVLSSGEKIDLTDSKTGVIGKYGNIIVSKTKSGQLIYNFARHSGADQPVTYNSINTPRGGQIQVNLPDGTHVWLNAASTLIVPSNFDSAPERSVKLTGEAYFEVFHNKKVPFRVRSQGQVVEVFGTHFNVNAYDDEQEVKTTLLQGSVKVNSAKLIPGQQAIMDHGQIKVVDADTEMETAWKDGEFNFEGQEFKTLMRAISRWYDIEVVYDFEPVGLHIGAQISRSRNLTELLSRLEQTGDVKFKVEGRRIRVFK